MFLILTYTRQRFKKLFNYFLATVSSSKTDQTTIMIFLNKNKIYKKILVDDEIKCFVHFVNSFEYETVKCK